MRSQIIKKLDALLIKFWHFVKHIVKRLLKKFEKTITIIIHESWSNDYGIGIRGEIYHKDHPLECVEICSGNACENITCRTEQNQIAERRGFWVHLPRLATHQFTFSGRSQGTTWKRRVTFNATKQKSIQNLEKAEGSFDDFVEQVNENNLSVLEIGSRIVSPGAKSLRELFHSCSSYTGFDYYSDANTDVVGDAHCLSKYFQNQKFDAVYSISVFEHLAMPWVVALEINKILKPGGITFHSSHFAWPVHESPWDFWRFTEEGFKVLFSSALGFKTKKTIYFGPLRMHPDNVVAGQENFPMYECYGGVSIFTKKIDEVNIDKFRWDSSLKDVLEPESEYPRN